MTTPTGEADERRRTRLGAIRVAHSSVFLLELWAIVWLVVSGLQRRQGASVRLAALLVAGESVVFIGNHGVCPLTPLAERYGAEDGRVSDIYLPGPLARTIPFWSIPLVALGVALHLRNRVQRTARSG